MDDGLYVELGIVLALILANGIFAAAEIAIVSARRGRLEQRASEGQRGAKIALDLADDPNRFLSTVQVGITLISTLAAAFGGASLAEAIAAWLLNIPQLAPYAEGLALAAVVALISYLSLILGELVPKRVALQNADGIATTLAPLMRILARVTAPLVNFLTFSADIVLRLIRRHNVEETPVNEEDVVALVREGVQEGTLDAAEQVIINNVFNFTERSVRSIMTPRTQMVALEAGAPFAAVMRVIAERGFSRFPVYAGDLDNIVGVLYVKDLIELWGSGPEPDLAAVLRPPVYVVEGQSALDAFGYLKQRRASLAIVVDEYGGVSGLITVGDLLEEVVGAIPDEYSASSERISRLEDGGYLVDGLLPISELVERLPIPEIEELEQRHGFETVAGLLLVLFGDIPAAGDKTDWQGYSFEVLDMDAMRIDKVVIRRTSASPDRQSEGALALGAALPPIYRSGKEASE